MSHPVAVVENSVDTADSWPKDIHSDEKLHAGLRWKGATAVASCHRCCRVFRGCLRVLSVYSGPSC